MSEWRDISSAPRETPGLFPVIVCAITEFEDGTREIAWAHVAYRSLDGSWLVNTAGMRVHGNASFLLGNPTHWMPLPPPETE